MVSAFIDYYRKRAYNSGYGMGLLSDFFLGQKWLIMYPQ